MSDPQTPLPAEPEVTQWEAPEGAITDYDAADEKKGPWPPEGATQAAADSAETPAAHPSVAHRSAADKPVEVRWPIAPLPEGYQGEQVMVTGADGNPTYISVQEANEQQAQRTAELEAAKVSQPSA